MDGYQCASVYGGCSGAPDWFFGALAVAIAVIVVVAMARKMRATHER